MHSYASEQVVPPLNCTVNLSTLLAVQSIIDLGGRFFGGRTVSATFFDEARFDKSDLAPKAGELN